MNRNAAAMLAGLLLVATPGKAFDIVYDPTNYAQNLQTAANTLRQIDNQLASLRNQTQMLLNQAKHLTSLPTTLLSDIDRSFTQTLNLLHQADKIVYDVQAIEQAFEKYQNFNATSSDQQLINGARDRWQTSLSAFQHSMSVGATAVSNLSFTQAHTDTLVSASQAAVGSLQAGQAGNQLLAVQVRQLSDLTAMIAAHTRAQALEMARHGAAEDQGHEQTRRFLTNGHDYQPQTVTIFH